MAVADASSLLAGLERLLQATERSPAALQPAALEAIDLVKQNAVALLGSQTSQVGFNLPQFLVNISQPGPLLLAGTGEGAIGILDTDLMGTVADFEAIANVPGLFHQGTQDRHGTWRNLIYPNITLREEVAQLRQGIWGEKTPQWLLLNEGFSGNGAFPDTPATHFVESAVGPSFMENILIHLRSFFVGV